LHGPPVRRQVTLHSERSGRIVQLSVNYDNAVAAVERTLRSDNERSRRLVQRFVVTRTCSVCQGSRLRPEALTSQLGGRNLAEISAVLLDELGSFMAALPAGLPVIELGPGAGALGGTVIAEGTPAQLQTDRRSIMGRPRHDLHGRRSHTSRDFRAPHHPEPCALPHRRCANRGRRRSGVQGHHRNRARNERTGKPPRHDIRPARRALRRNSRFLLSEPASRSTKAQPPPTRCSDWPSSSESALPAQAGRCSDAASPPKSGSSIYPTGPEAVSGAMYSSTEVILPSSTTRTCMMWVLLRPPSTPSIQAFTMKPS
jgi:hypothetical protein